MKDLSGFPEWFKGNLTGLLDSHQEKAQGIWFVSSFLMPLNGELCIFSTSSGRFKPSLASSVKGET